MTAREKMIAFRKKYNDDYDLLSRKCNVSARLIEMIENGHVTHLNIVERIRKVYHLTNLEAEELLPINRRKHGGDYDPDRYFVPERKEISIVKSDKYNDIYDAYRNTVVSPRAKKLTTIKNRPYQRPNGGY